MSIINDLRTTNEKTNRRDIILSLTTHVFATKYLRKFGQNEFREKNLACPRFALKVISAHKPIQNRRSI